MSAVPERLTAALADRYRLERELGQGGMATVYLAEDLKHKRKVALKVLKPELAAVLGADRFVQEITTTASLQHPHILPLFDSGTADGFLFYVMPFIDGETLRTKLDRETQLGVAEAVQITCEVADALHYAHQQGVIHRDIKPENILLHNGRPMVADFGIALAVSAAAGGRMTETGLSLGTPHYMSPEQATAEKELSPRSDVYSLGSVLYEMLTGDPPHTGASAQQIIMKIVTEEAAPVTRVRKSAPPNVVAAVAKALEKLPADRFGSAREFAEALRNPGFSTGAVGTAAGGARSPRLREALALGLMIGALAGAGAVRLLAPPAAAPAGERYREQLTFSGLAQRPAISPDGAFVAFVETRCEYGQTGHCRSSLLVQEVGSTQPRVLLSDALLLDTPRWSHDGQTLVVGGQLDQQRHGLFAVPRLSGTAQLIGPRGAYDTHPAGDSVLLVPPREAGAGVALVISLTTGAVSDSFALPIEKPSDIAWSPDGGHIAAAVGTGVQIVDRAGRRTGAMATSNRPSLRWSARGTALLFFRLGAVREDQLVRVAVGPGGSFVGGAEVMMARVPTIFRGQFDIARRTGRLVIGTGDAITDIWSFDLTTRPPRGHRETRGTTWYGDPALSLDGKALYYYRGDALGDNVYRLDQVTGTEEALTAQRLPGGNAMRLSADGRRLAYMHSTDSTERLEYIEFPSRRVFAAPARISSSVVPVVPEGFLAVLSDGDRLAILDSLGGTWKPVPVPDSLAVVAFAASPDGSLVAFVAIPHGTSGEQGTGLRSQFGLRPLKLGFVSLATGEARLVGELEPDEPTPGMSWDRDGTLYLGRWLAADDTPSIWQLMPGDGALRRITSLPSPCSPASITIGALGRAAACKLEDFRSDIWLIDTEGVTR